MRSHPRGLGFTKQRKGGPTGLRTSMVGPQRSTSRSPQDRETKTLLQVRDLRTHFRLRRGVWGRSPSCVRAVDGVSFDVQTARTLGLVGESGCGKTTVGRTILRLIPATTGEVWFEGSNVLSLGRGRLGPLRRRMQAVFQDPSGSLNPRMTVGQIVGEGLTVHRMARGSGLRERVAAVLSRVGLSPDDAGRYPHEFSGGQRQRIGIARALATEPGFIVCDEPVSALDVSIQAQILNLLAELQAELGLSYLFISHNLAVVRQFCDQVAVMYLGKLVEVGGAGDVCGRPGHPYSLALLSASPEPDPSRRGRLELLSGEPASPANPPPGCAFHPRCPLAGDECRRVEPSLEHKPGLLLGHRVACHHADQSLKRGPQTA